MIRDRPATSQISLSHQILPSISNPLIGTPLILLRAPESLFTDPFLCDGREDNLHSESGEYIEGNGESLQGSRIETARGRNLLAAFCLRLCPSRFKTIS